MEEELLMGLVVICAFFAFIMLVGPMFGSTASDKKKKFVRNRFDYKKVDNLYKEFILSCGKKYDDLEYDIRLSYFIVLGSFIVIPMTIYYLFYYNYSQLFLIATILFVILLTVIIYFIYNKKIPYLLNRKNDLFKDGLIRYIISENLSDFKYKSDEGIDEKEYSSSGFYEKYNMYYSEDLMEGTLGNNNVSLAEVETLNKNETTERLFHGLFAHISLSNNSNKNYIITSKDIVIKNRYKVDTPFEVFNRIYSVYSTENNKIDDLFDSKTLELLCELNEKSNLSVDIKIEGKDIYLRFWTGPLFDELIFSREEKKRLYQFSLICDIIKSINASAEK